MLVGALDDVFPRSVVTSPFLVRPFLFALPSRQPLRLSDEVADRHKRVLDLLSLPTSYPAGRWNTLLATMQRDKKARAGQLRFIVLDDLAKPTVMLAPDQSLLFAAYQEIAS